MSALGHAKSATGATVEGLFSSPDLSVTPADDIRLLPALLWCLARRVAGVLMHHSLMEQITSQHLETPAP